MPHITGREKSDIPAPLRAEAEAVVMATVKACVRIARRKDNELPLPAAWFPNVKISWSAGRNRSRGGKGASSVYAGGGISLALAQHVAGGQDRTFNEYSHVADSPIIGSLPKTRWQTVVAAVTCHEIAHAIQFVVRGRSARCRKVDFKTAHGRGWQQVYALLRREIVNPLLAVSSSIHMPASAPIPAVAPTMVSISRADKIKAFSKLLGFAVDVRLEHSVNRLIHK